MARLWLKIMKDHRIDAQMTAPCVWGEEKEVLVDLCKEADLPCPMWLTKHETQYNQFRRTRFTSENFVEEINFDSMDIEYLDDTGKKRKSTDPRNQF